MEPNDHVLPKRRHVGVGTGGLIVIAGILIWIFWSSWVGLIVILVGLIAFAGFARGRWC
jgi:hypothetical protein